MVNETPVKEQCSQTCQHCGSDLVMWDATEKEHYCFVCGWRRAVRITREQCKKRSNRRRIEFLESLFSV